MVLRCGCLNHAPKLADVARPRVTPEDLQNLRGETANVTTRLACELEQKMVGEFRYVFSSIAERRDPDRDLL